MTRPVAVLDACVLVPIRLATTMLWLAEAGMFQPLWSERILDEVERNLPDVGIDPERAARRVGMMRDAFGDEAMVGDFDGLIEQMTCDAKDRHVLAAAVAGGAEALVTFNLEDFPPRSTRPHQIETVHPDRFLLGLYGAQPDLVRATIEREIAAFRHPPETIVDFLHTLMPTVPKFAERVARS